MVCKIVSPKLLQLSVAVPCLFLPQAFKVGFSLCKGEEHLDYLEASDEDKSVLWLHSVHHHQSRQGVQYSMMVTGAFKEPLDRQIMERVQIQNFKGPCLMNRRSEMGGVRVERMQYRRWGGE